MTDERKPDTEYIKKLFPEVDEIEDASLKDLVVKVWLVAMERGGWETIDSIPFTLLVPTEATLVEHTRRVTRMAMAVARERYDLDMDIVVAGGLTHDVGKLLEYEETGGQVMKSRFGSLVRHPVSGYALSMEVGLPLEVAHIIAAHSAEGEKVSRTPEAILINHCDFIDFDIAKSTAGGS
jgi:putative nucleotidyltransferase with HDIG domain